MIRKLNRPRMQRDLLNWMDFLQHAQLPTHMCSFALGNMKIAQNQELLSKLLRQDTMMC